MAVTRKSVEFAKVIAYDRWHDPYQMGGVWNPFDRAQGTDCSDCVGKECAAVRDGAAMPWARQVSTESWRPPSMGGGANPSSGPYGSIMVNHPSEFPPDAAVKIAFHHGDGSAADSHTWCQVDNLKIETMGGNRSLPGGGTVLNDGVRYLDDTLDVHDTSYANNWWFIPGPIIEDGTPLCTGPSSPTAATPDKPHVDTLFADVSEWQGRAVDDSYPYKTISIRSHDGAHVDNLWHPNLAYCKAAVDSGRWPFFLVYFVWRPGFDNVGQLKTLVGDPHPKMAVEIDIESWGGQITGDQSRWLNADRAAIGAWLGDPRRCGGYGNNGDLGKLWPGRPGDLVVRLAAFGSNPDLDGPGVKVSHQYTNGTGYGDGLPEGAPPWPSCDMNSADGYDPAAFAAAYGITADAPPSGPPPPPPPPPAPQTFQQWVTTASDRDLLEYITNQLGPGDPAWSSKGSTLRDELWKLATPAAQQSAIEEESK